MAKSGAQQRPARVLVFAPGLTLDRVLNVLRRHAYIVEVAEDVPALVYRLEKPPTVDVLIVNGTDEMERARVLVAAREHNTWCLHLRSGTDPSELPSVQRDALLAALPLDADDARIASTIGLVIAARRSKSAS